jgi:hypothetical protein
MKIRLVGAELFHACERTDGQDEVKSSFAKASKNSTKLSDNFTNHSMTHNSLVITCTSDSHHIQSVPLATEPGISVIILSQMKILQRNLKRTYLIV